MSTGAVIAIVGGVVVVGAGVFLLSRRSTAATAPKPAAKKNSSAGDLIASLGGSFVSHLGQSLGNGLSDELSSLFG